MVLLGILLLCIIMRKQVNLWRSIGLPLEVSQFTSARSRVVVFLYSAAPQSGFDTG
jgi:hypothetical protein